ncbi:Carotenoid oxygenase [Dillenia turbinata]|uniref:Carotenoid oxygenase n=1 Tax=Dillenia turbinata TaxID=194707 RepID=A0AAN8VC66_9MAGN
MATLCLALHANGSIQKQTIPRSMGQLKTSISTPLKIFLIFLKFISTVSVFGKSNEVWVEGEGMIHAVYFSKDPYGNWTVSYNNKYVDTETYRLEKQRNKPSLIPAVEGDPPAVLAALTLNLLRYGVANKYLSNTIVFEHSGKYNSVAENWIPQEIDIFTLKTLRDWDLNGTWRRPFTSRPKKAPGTGELVIMGADGKKPYYVVGVISGEVQDIYVFSIHYPSILKFVSFLPSADGKRLIHKADLKYNVILDDPLVVDVGRVIKGGPLIKYEKNAFARIGVMPRFGDGDSVKWFEVEPNCTFHIINCFEDGHEVVVRGCKAQASIIPGPDLGLNKFQWFSQGFMFHNSHHENTSESAVGDGGLFTCVYEWRLNMETGEVKDRNLSGTELSMEFPMINNDYTGPKHKYGYTQVIDPVASSTCGKPKYGSLAKLYFDEHGHDSTMPMKMEYHMLPPNNFFTGATFVAKPASVEEEDEGWIMAFVHDENTKVVVVDAKKFEAEPTEN